MDGSILVPQKGGLGVRHLSSALEKETGRALKLYFLNKLPSYSLYDEHEIKAIKKEVESDDWVGISVTAIGLERTRQLVRALKEDPRLSSKPLLVGGVQAFSSPQMFYEMGADAVCRQEAEIWLPQALRMLAKGGVIPRDFETETPKHDEIPPPDYDFTKGMHYVLGKGRIERIESAEGEFTAIENFSITGPKYPLWLFTDRRCRFNCTYCVNHKLKAFDKTHGGPPGRISTPNLLAQVKETIARYPLIDHVVFFDDDFLPRFLDGKKTKEGQLELFCGTWKRDIARPFFIYFSPMTFNEGILNALIGAGLRKLNFGYQSRSERALKHYGRPGTPLGKLKEMAEFTSKAFAEGRLDVPDVDFIINSPFETAADMRSTIEAIVELAPPFDTQMHNMRFFPGYRLTEMFSSMGTELQPLPGYKTILDREYQDHTPHSEWLWPNMEDDRAYFTVLQMLMTGLCTEDTLGVLRREEIRGWLDAGQAERRRRMPEMRALFGRNQRIRYYDELTRRNEE